MWFKDDIELMAELQLDKYACKKIIEHEIEKKLLQSNKEDDTKTIDS